MGEVYNLGPMDFTRIKRYQDLIDDWPAFLDACQAPLPTTFWCNTTRLSSAELVDHLGRDGIEAAALDWYPGGFRAPFEARPGKTLAFILGYLHIQEEVSMLPIYFLDPQPGDRVLDLCAAPGNKTVQAAVRLADSGTVLANDINVQRLGMVMRNIDRLGLTNTYVTHHNGSNLPADLGKFDRVLADVPCGCEGTTRKNPDLLWSEPPDLERVARGQLAILRKGIQRCRAGGRIVYSTCTYAPEENEAVVHAALEEFQDLSLVECRVPGWTCSPGLREWQGRSFRPELTRALRIYPHQNDTGGFFVAVFERASVGETEA